MFKLIGVRCKMKPQEVFYEDLFILIASGKTVNQACNELGLDYNETCDDITNNEDFTLKYEIARKQRRDVLLQVITQNAIKDRIRTKTTEHRDVHGIPIKTTVVEENIGPNVDAAKWLLERDNPEEFAMPYLKTNEEQNLSKVDIFILDEASDKEEDIKKDKNSKDIY